MAVTNLRKVGGSVMVSLPPALLAKVGLSAGKAVEIDVEGDKLVIKAQTQPEYHLETLLQEHKAAGLAGDDAWRDNNLTGREDL